MPPVDVLTVSAATRRWGDRTALDGVSFAVRAGEIFALLGPNGAGKTTLIRAITGRAPLHAGEIRLRPPTDPARRGASPIGLVPQTIALYPHLTARENLAVFARLAGLPPGAVPPAVGLALERVGLTARADDRTADLSGGMQRRVNIAAGVLHDPALLLLDEPTVGVDVVARDAIHGVLRALRRDGLAILLTTHDLEQAAELADRVGILSHGRLLAADAPERLIADTFASERELTVTLAAAAPPASRALLEAAGLRAAHQGAVWSGPLGGGLDRASDLARRLEDAGAGVAEVRLREPSLRSVFFQLAGEEVGP